MNDEPQNPDAKSIALMLSPHVMEVLKNIMLGEKTKTTIEQLKAAALILEVAGLIAPYQYGDE